MAFVAPPGLPSELGAWITQTEGSPGSEVGAAEGRVQFRSVLDARPELAVEPDIRLDDRQVTLPEAAAGRLYLAFWHGQVAIPQSRVALHFRVTRASGETETTGLREAL